MTDHAPALPRGPSPRRVARRLDIDGVHALTRRLAGRLAIVGLGAASATLAAGAAHRSFTLVPSAWHRFPAWLAGPLGGLGQRRTVHDVALLLVVIFACYLVALACARDISPRWAIGGIVAAHVAFLLGPPLFSADVLSYIDIARLAPVHGVNPYLHGAAAVPGDPAFPYVRWHTVVTPYGPIFTLATWGLTPLSVPVALWALKAISAACSLACVALVWRIAQQRGHDPVAAALFLGANPLVLAHTVGGGHNDPLLMAIVLLAISWALAGRTARSGVAVVVAMGVKISAALVAPFMLLGTRHRGTFLRSAVVSALGVAALALVAFGVHGLGFVSQLSQQQEQVNSHSVPMALTNLLGLRRVPDWLRLALGASFAAVLAANLWRTWRGGDWIVAAGWATLAALLATAWLTPWYAIWLLPLAAVSDHRRLRFAAVLLCGYIIAARAVPLLVHHVNAGLT